MTMYICIGLASRPVEGCVCPIPHGKSDYYFEKH